MTMLSYDWKICELLKMSMLKWPGLMKWILQKLNSGTECAVKDSKNTPCLDKIPDLKKLKTDPANFNKNLREKLINVGILAKISPFGKKFGKN